MGRRIRSSLGRSACGAVYLAIPLLVLLAAAGVAMACVGPAEPTTTTTSLSGESKSGASITVLEGAKVKDQATIEGKNAGKATGKISYFVYADSSCKELVTKAGEIEFTGGKVPASEEMTLEGGRVYYWQAHYGGDSLNAESTSSCGSEVLTVKAATSLVDTLSSEDEELVEGAEISIFEGTPAKDKATLSGTRSGTATGKVTYKVYSDKECKVLVTGAGEGAVEAGSVGASAEVTLGKGTYYWRSEYGGDALHQESKSACGKAVQVVNLAEFKSEVPRLSTIIAKGGPATITPHAFFTGIRSITCNEASLESSSFAPPVTSFSISTLSYAQCTSNGHPATVKPNQCGFGIGSDGKFMVQSCGMTKIELTIYANAAEHTAGNPECKYKIGNQEAQRVRFNNGGALATRDIAIRFEVAGLTIEKVFGGALECGESGATASYGGATTMKGFDATVPNPQVGWWRG
jgi:hypothetical protein